MKKILLSIAIVLTMSFGAKAQFGITDAFFNDWETSRSLELVMPGLPFMHGETGDVSAPLGSGLLVLSALGAGYAVARRKKNYS